MKYGLLNAAEEPPIAIFTWLLLPNKFPIPKSEYGDVMLTWASANRLLEIRVVAISRIRSVLMCFKVEI